MKRVLSLLAFAILIPLTVLVGCKNNTIEPTPEDPTLAINFPKDKEVLDHKSQRFSFEIETNYEWSAKVINTKTKWVTLNPSSSNKPGKSTVTVTVASNNEPEMRQCDIAITVKDLVKHITIKQETAIPELTYTISEELVANQLTVFEHTGVIDITNIGTWTIETDSDWVTLDATEGNGSGSIAVSIASNINTQAPFSRRSTVTINWEGRPKNIVINQDGNDVTHRFNPSFITALKEQQYIDMYASKIFIADVKNIKRLDLQGGTFRITSLSGIEYFENLTALNCASNKLNSLDISKNSKLTILYCFDNKIPSLDISHLPELDTLNCSTNLLEELDISKNLKLVEFNCAGNNIQNVNLDNHTSLLSLNISNNPINNINISKNTALKLFSCANIPMVSIDISNNINLESFNCSRSSLANLNLSGNPKLTSVSCQNTPISSLDLSNNPALVTLTCNDTKLTKLDLSSNPALIVILCFNTPMTELNLTNCSKLVSLNCSHSSLANINLTDCTALAHMSCINTLTPELDLSHNTELITLYCSEGALTGLDISSCKKLLTMNCAKNPGIAGKFTVKTWSGFQWENYLLFTRPNSADPDSNVYYTPKVI